MHTKYYFPFAEIKNDSFITGGQNLFDKPTKNILIAVSNTRKITTGQRNDYAIASLLHYNYFNKYYNVITIDLSTQQALDAYGGAIQ